MALRAPGGKKGWPADRQDTKAYSWVPSRQTFFRPTHVPLPSSDLPARGAWHSELASSHREGRNTFQASALSRPEEIRRKLADAIEGQGREVLVTVPPLGEASSRRENG